MGGNSRYKACKELGHKEIWVEYREPKDDAEALEMAIADNESSGEWIKSLLIEQIKLNEDKINLEDYKITIENTELSNIFAEEKEKEKDDFEFESLLRVFVDCTDEPMQERVFNDLQKLGYDPKVINV